MNALTPETLAELEQLNEKRTPGPWTHDGGWTVEAVQPEGWTGPYIVAATDQCRTDAALIAAAVNHLPALIFAARDLLRADAQAAAWCDAAYEWEQATSRARAERDAALAEVAALRERMAALADEWAVHAVYERSIGPVRGTWANAARHLRAALDVDTAGHDDSSERDGGR